MSAAGEPTERTQLEADLLAALKDTCRMLQAVRLSAGLGKAQVRRLNAAQELITRAEVQP